MGEKKIVSTFYWNSEGLGYLQIVSSALYPFYFTSISKYIVDADLILTPNILVAASAIFLLGFFIMFASNYIKYEFRNNPLRSSLMRKLYHNILFKYIFSSVKCFPHSISINS